jgi:hypothetical protein
MISYAATRGGARSSSAARISARDHHRTHGRASLRIPSACVCQRGVMRRSRPCTHKLIVSAWPRTAAQKHHANIDGMGHKRSFRLFTGRGTIVAWRGNNGLREFSGPNVSRRSLAARCFAGMAASIGKDWAGRSAPTPPARVSTSSSRTRRATASLARALDRHTRMRTQAAPSRPGTIRPSLPPRTARLKGAHPQGDSQRRLWVHLGPRTPA